MGHPVPDMVVIAMHGGAPGLSLARFGVSALLLVAGPSAHPIELGRLVEAPARGLYAVAEGGGKGVGPFAHGLMATADGAGRFGDGAPEQFEGVAFGHGLVMRHARYCTPIAHALQRSDAGGR